MSLFRRRSAEEKVIEADTELSRLIMEVPGTIGRAQLVRALAHSVVHVPMPGEPAESRPRVVRASEETEGPPLYVLEDEDGKHALVYSTAKRLVQAMGGITAATVPFAALATAWPEDVDLVIDPGHPEAYEVSVDTLRYVVLEVAGIPSAVTTALSPEDLAARRPDPERLHVLEMSRVCAERAPEIRALYRAELTNPAISDDPMLYLVVETDAFDDDLRRAETMHVLAATTAKVDSAPLGILHSEDGQESPRQNLIDAVVALDPPYWQRQ
jgi:hypothetical protein